MVKATHITAGVFIDDDESGLRHDYDAWLEKPAPTSRCASTGTATRARTMPTPT